MMNITIARVLQNYKKSALAIATPFLLVTMLNSNIAFAADLKVGWEQWEPYQHRLDNGVYSGIDLEVFSLVAERSGLDYAFEEMPWSRLLDGLKEGKMEIATGASKNEERAVWAHFTEPYRTESVVLFVRKGEADKHRLRRLSDITRANFQLGVTLGYYYGESYKSLIENPKFKANVQPVRKDELNFEKLARGRIDGFLMDPISGKSQLEESAFKDIVEIHPIGVIYSDNIYFMLSKESGSEEILAKLNQTLAEIKQDGSHAAIVRKYSVVE